MHVSICVTGITPRAFALSGIASPFCICAEFGPEVKHCLCPHCGLCDLWLCGDLGSAPEGREEPQRQKRLAQEEVDQLLVERMW